MLFSDSVALAVDAIAAINLSADASFLTAWANDTEYGDVFARQVEAHRHHACCLIGISTSGKSPSVVNAGRMAFRHRIPVIALTGEDGGELGDMSSVLLNVPSDKTEVIQQVHQLIYHHLCGEVEAAFSSESVSRMPEGILRNAP
jgi:D-sedoheptulose 7-phosphate isomerase